MKKTLKQILEAVLGIVVFLLVLGFVGSYERTEMLIYSMSQQTYEAIIKKLGNNATQKEIAREYTENKVFYDTHY